MKACPDCNAPWRVNAKSCACGYKLPPATPPKPEHVGRDPDYWRCVHELLGQRCNEPGSFKRGDKWYCALHAGKKPLDEIAKSFGEKGLAQARAILANAKPIPRRFGDAGARRVGEIVTPGEVESAREARTFEDDIPWRDGRE